MLFPGGRLPLRIFEQRYMAMAKDCLRNETAFGVCLIRAGAEVGAPATPADVGTLARITAWDMRQLGVLQVTALGERRFRILERRVQPDGLGVASIELLSEEIDSPLSGEFSHCTRLLERVLDQHPGLAEQPYRLDSCAWVSARLAELLPLPLDAKQALLELDDARARLERLNGLIRPAGPSKV